MASEEVTVRPPYALVLVGDPVAEVPESMGGDLVAAGPACLAVGTLSDADGATRVRLVDGGSDQELPPILAFEGTVDLPDGVLSVSSVYGEAYIERASSDRAVAVEVWVNDDREPDD